MDEFTKYYTQQAQVGGAGGGAPLVEAIGPVYKAGFSRGQEGRGVVTNALKGLWNWVSPLFSSGAQALGKEALSTGAKILGDAASTSNTSDLGDIAKARLAEGRDTLVKKMRGGARRRRRRSKSVNPKRRKRMRTKGDIFG